MSGRINPFHNLYLSEAIGPQKFVELFSPKFVKHATALFQPGHVVLQGLQGSGKTMLLNLLKPETRIAYFNEERDFPVPSELSKFISAGINLRKSGLIEFGQLVLPETKTNELKKLALQYGDFLNYWVIADLLHTLTLFQAENEGLQEAIGLSLKAECLDRFARNLSKDPVFFGYLKGCQSFREIVDRIRGRIITYRKYINANLESDQLPSDIASSTTVVGEPVSKVSEFLKLENIIDDDVEIYIRIDQYEQLETLNTDSSNFGSLCRDLTHKILASRDSRVSYRLGTRHYAWPTMPKIFSTNDVLEHKRDYSIIDIDDKLRRKENPRTWIFPDFAGDIFRRRLEYAGYELGKKRNNYIKTVFGQTLSVAERAAKYVSDDAREQIIKFDGDATPAWRKFLREIYAKDPLQGRFADAWAHQKAVAKRRLLIEPPSLEEPFPWSEKKYWIKERNEQALLQLASANRQQLIWSGMDDILAISGGNILVFLFVCQQIWDVWLRDRHGSDIPEGALPEIEWPIQSQGIREASEEWVKKVKEGARSDLRAQFLSTIGNYFYGKLTGDRSMSYPGVNGFSISVEELNRYEDVRQFIRLCVEFGDLYEAPHTSKNKGESRKKYYLAPIFSPYFKIPHQHTKEPLYIDAKQVRAWLQSDSEVRQPSKDKPLQLNFFDGA